MREWIKSWESFVLWARSCKVEVCMWWIPTWQDLASKLGFIFCASRQLHPLVKVDFSISSPSPQPCTLQLSLTHIVVSHHTCYSSSSSFQGKGIIEVKLQYITQSTMPSDNLSVMDSWKSHIHTSAHTKMCQHILWVLLDRNREWQW